MKPIRLALVTAAAGALVLAGATPASAAGASIDPGDSLYAINCDASYPDWQLLSVDPSTAVSTTIGNGSGAVSEDPSMCAAQPAYNPVTGASYYIQWEWAVGDAAHHTYLATIDVETGASTRIGEFFWNAEGVQYPLINALAIGLDGTAWALGNDGNPFYRVDLNTGELTNLGWSLCCTWALAVHPVTGDLYGIDDENGLFIVDREDGDFEYLGTIALGETETIYSLQIDQAGRFWIMVERYVLEVGFEAHLWSTTLDTLADPIHSGEFVDDPYYTAALLLIPGAEVLPATGPANTTLPAVAGVLVLLGAAVVTVTAIRRRATA